MQVSSVGPESSWRKLYSVLPNESDLFLHGDPEAGVI